MIFTTTQTLILVLVQMLLFIVGIIIGRMMEMEHSLTLLKKVKRLLRNKMEG